MSEKRTLYLASICTLPLAFPDGILISIARLQKIPSMTNVGLHDCHLD